MHEMNAALAIKYSVIIPAYNAEGTLDCCLKALMQQSMSGRSYEIIVVDDGSIDHTARVAAAYPAVRYFYQPNQGPAAARNRGAEAAVGDIILFTDADCIPDPEWMREMVSPFEQSNVAAVKGAYKTRQREWAARFAQLEFEDRFDLLASQPYIDMVDTYSAAFRKDIFHRAGGFDVQFPVANNEDTDLSYRLAAAGHLMVFNPKAFVYHRHPDVFMTYFRTKFWRGYWRMVVYRRFPEKAFKDSYTPAVIKWQSLIIAPSIALLFISLFLPILWWPALAGLALVMLLALPFARKTFQKDKVIGLMSPLIVLLRSICFAGGSLMAVFCMALRPGRNMNPKLKSDLKTKAKP